jgi:lipoyl(octanoyl) transferase
MLGFMTPKFYSFVPYLSYEETHQKMEQTVENIIAKRAVSQIWFLEHESVYTVGTSAKSEDLLNPMFPVFHTGRGGQYTYHGPGQLVCYVMLPLNKNQQDLKGYVQALMDWVSMTLNDIGIKTEKDLQHIGLWVNRGIKKNKIAAFGIRVSKWVTWHGFSINISTNLNHFLGIVPCGIKNFGVTSLNAEGFFHTRATLEQLLRENFFKIDFFHK